MGMLLLLAVLQVQSLRPVENEDPRADRPRFAIGAEFAGGAAAAGEGGGVIFGAGVRAAVPLGERTSINLRVMHAVPQVSAGLYEVRWQRQVNWPGPFRPDYAGVGAVGFYWLETGLYGRVRPQLDTVTRPHMLSLTAGWEHRLGRHAAAPLEISVLAHPYGLLAATAGVGITWSPRGSR